MGVAVYYVVLGVDQRASDDDIHRAYQRLALNCWSSGDRHSTLAARRFRAVEEAYSVLGDPMRRAAYDAQLAGRMHGPSPTAGTVSPAISAPAAAPASAPLAIPPSVGTASPITSDSVVTRLPPSVLSAVLVALLILGMAGGPQRATSGRIVGPTGRRPATPDRAQPRGVPADGDPFIVAELDPGAAVRQMGQLRPSRAVLLTTQALPASRHRPPRGVSPIAATGLPPWEPARHLVARAAARTPMPSGVVVRQTRNAPPRRDIAPPRAAWLAPGDDAVPDLPATRRPPRPKLIRMVPRGARRAERGEWTGSHWRHGVHLANGRRRPPFSDGRGRGTLPSRSHF